ncbi:MAG TPA: ribosome biogenesis GTPase Der [Candidatus Binatia bacterium]
MTTPAAQRGGDAVVVAIAGRPNAGKSTLFNRLLRRQKAIVHDTPGVTRDENRGTLERGGRRWEIVDTGGIEEQAEPGQLAARVHERSLATIARADVIVYLLDGRAGLSPADEAVARRIRTLGVPAIFAVNKIDRPSHEERVLEFAELGEGDLVALSAAHGRGIDELWQRIEELAPPPPPREADAESTEDAAAEAIEQSAAAQDDEAGEADADVGGPARIALIGRPNVGKSSLLNRLVGFERSLVDATPGTTRDAVDVTIEHGGKTYVVVDTAGLRRPSRIDETIEAYAAQSSLRAMLRSEVAILVLDAQVGVTDQDLRLADLAWRRGRGLVVAVNKADLAPDLATEQCHATIAKRLPQWPPLPVLRVSAKEGTGMRALLAAVDTVIASYRQRVATSRLNEILHAAVEAHPPPSEQGRAVKLQYATQASHSPPHVVIFGTQRSALPTAYLRYLTHRLRDELALVGVPLKITVRRREGRHAKRPKPAKADASRKKRRPKDGGRARGKASGRGAR